MITFISKIVFLFIIIVHMSYGKESSTEDFYTDGEFDIEKYQETYYTDGVLDLEGLRDEYINELKENYYDELKEEFKDEFTDEMFEEYFEEGFQEDFLKDLEEDFIKDIENDFLEEYSTEEYLDGAKNDFLEKYNNGEVTDEIVEKEGTGSTLDTAEKAIEKINTLLKEKYDHKMDFLNENTRKLLKLEAVELLNLKITLSLKYTLIKICVMYSYQKDYEDLLNEYRYR